MHSLRLSLSLPLFLHQKLQKLTLIWRSASIWATEGEDLVSLAVDLLVILLAHVRVAPEAQAKWEMLGDVGSVAATPSQHTSR